MEDVLPVIRDFITDALLRRSEVQLEADVPLIEKGYLTSLQTVELVMFLEERFGIEIPPEEVSEERFATLAAISELVASKLG